MQFIIRYKKSLGAISCTDEFCFGKHEYINIHISPTFLHYNIKYKCITV